MGATSRTYCKFCVAKCGVLVDVDGDGTVTDVRGDPDHPVSHGYLCPKGRAIGRLHHHPDRLDVPTIGGSTPGWDAVLDHLAARLRTTLDEHGPTAVAGYGGNGGAQDGAGFGLLNRLLHHAGSANWYTALTIDSPAKGYVAELMAGYSGLTYHVDDDCELVLLVGTNPVVSHGHTTAMGDPIRYHRRLATAGDLWVLDPRRTETARLGRHLAVRPSTDHTVLAHLVREVLADGADGAFLDTFATGVSELAAAVAPFDESTTATVAGIDVADLRDLVAAVRRRGRLAVITGTGATMSPTANVVEWLALALAAVTGSLERQGGMWFNPGPGDGWRTRTYTPKEGGARPGPPSRPELPRRWGQFPCAGLIDEIESGNVRALLVMGGNPLASFPEPDRVRRALASLDVLGVLDIVASPMTELATHVLPCAGDLERADAASGVISSNPAVFAQWAPAVVPLGADRKPAWWILCELADRAGIEPLLPLEARVSDETVLHALTGFDPGRADMHWGELVDYHPSLGWVADRVLPDGRWRLAPAPLVAQLAALVVPNGALRLVPRRQLRHMNSALLDTGGVRQDVPTLQVHPDDAAAAGVGDGDTVEVRSSHGAVRAVVELDDGIRHGVVSLPHGFVDTNVNALTSLADGVDPLTGMVQLSGVVVTIVPSR